MSMRQTRNTMWRRQPGIFLSRATTSTMAALAEYQWQGQCMPSTMRCLCNIQHRRRCLAGCSKDNGLDVTSSAHMATALAPVHILPLKTGLHPSRTTTPLSAATSVSLVGCHAQFSLYRGSAAVAQHAQLADQTIYHLMLMVNFPIMAVSMALGAYFWKHL